VTSAGRHAAYVDTDYLGFCSAVTRESSADLVAANLAAIWPNFAASGATCLVVAGVVVTTEQRALYESSIPDASLTLCRLRARPETQACRILRRSQAEGLESDGGVSGLTEEHLRDYAEQSAGFAALLEANDIADFAIETADLSIPEVARAVLSQAGAVWTGVI
jgi:hypothetical protein